MSIAASARHRTRTRQFDIVPANPRCDRAAIVGLIRATKIGTDLHRVPIANYVVAKVDGVIVGCAGFGWYFRGGRDVAILTHVAVKKEFRHRGIGGALIQDRMRQAEYAGACMIGLVSMYYHFNLYKRRGFRTCPRKDLPDELRGYWMFRDRRYMKCAAMWRHLRG